MSDAAGFEALLKRNVRFECGFNALNGLFMGMILFAAPVIAKTCLDAPDWQIALLMSTFPAGALLGPIWGSLARKWGLQKLVLRMGFLSNLPIFLIPLHDRIPGIPPSIGFSILVTLSVLAYSGVRMGQTGLYHATYPRSQRGKIVGLLLFCNFFTMVPFVLLVGVLVDPRWGFSVYNYLWLMPIAAVFGVAASFLYARVKAPVTTSAQPMSMKESFQQAKQILTSDVAYRRFQIGYFFSGSAFFLSAPIVLVLCKENLAFGSSNLALGLNTLPQLILAITSPFWGRIMDRIGIERARLFIVLLMLAYLICFILGIWLLVPTLIYIGGFLRGVAEGGGQVTWALASVQFAPTAHDVPAYNGIHFGLNGVRGVMMPYLAIVLMDLFGVWGLLAALLSAFISLLTVQRSNRKNKRTPAEKDPIFVE